MRMVRVVQRVVVGSWWGCRVFKHAVRIAVLSLHTLLPP